MSWAPRMDKFSALSHVFSFSVKVSIQQSSGTVGGGTQPPANVSYFEGSCEMPNPHFSSRVFWSAPANDSSFFLLHSVLLWCGCEGQRRPQVWVLAFILLETRSCCCVFQVTGLKACGSSPASASCLTIGELRLQVCATVARSPGF